MAPQPPLILVDNVFDAVNLYPLATRAWSTAIVGREGNYAADYRRERSYYQAAAAAATQGVWSDLGTTLTNKTVDSLWIDRGHNLWGKDVLVTGDDGAGGSLSNAVEWVVPALGTVGGDPTTGFCVTEEGALYTLFATSAARRRWFVRVTDVWAPIFTGIILGTRVQLSSISGWSGVRDEDAGERSDRNEASLVPGYEGYDRTYSARSVELRFAYIGATEYDATMRAARRTLFEVNQPAVIAMNYGTSPERAWLYKYRGKNWNAPMQKAYRNWTGQFFEYGPLVR